MSRKDDFLGFNKNCFALLTFILWIEFIIAKKKSRKIELNLSSDICLDFDLFARNHNKMTSDKQFKELIRAPDGIVQQEHKQHSVVLLKAQEENNYVGSGLELAKIHHIIMD